MLLTVTLIVVKVVAAILGVLGAVLLLAYHKANGIAWSIGLAAGVAVLDYFTGTPAWRAVDPLGRRGASSR